MSLWLWAAVSWLPTHAADWPHWRGPHYTGASDETGLPASWGEKENVAWVAPMPGPSSATPIVWGGRVFVSSTDKSTGDLLALCLDIQTGKTLWRRTTGKDRAWPGNNMASPSPVTDGRTVWFHYGSGELAAFDFDGKELWARDLQKDYGPFILKWGPSASPLLYRDRLFLPVFQNASPTKYDRPYKYPPKPSDEPLPSYILALDPATGETLWKHVRPTDATDESTEAYNTLIPFESGGRAEFLAVASEFVTGHDPATGKELWRWEFTPSDRQTWQRVVTSAVPGDGLVYATRPKHRALFALRAGAQGKAGNDLIAWKFDGPHVPDASTPLLYQGRLYVQDGDAKVLTCLDAKTGERKWQAKLGTGAVLRASPTGADGKVYCMSEDAEVLVLAAGDQFKLLSRIPLRSAPSRSTIAAAHGRLFVRTAKALYCVSSKKE